MSVAGAPSWSAGYVPLVALGGAACSSRDAPPVLSVGPGDAGQRQEHLLRFDARANLLGDRPLGYGASAFGVPGVTSDGTLWVLARYDAYSFVLRRQTTPGDLAHFTEVDEFLPFGDTNLWFATDTTAVVYSTPDPNTATLQGYRSDGSRAFYDRLTIDASGYAGGPIVPDGNEGFVLAATFTGPLAKQLDGRLATDGGPTSGIGYIGFDANGKAQVMQRTATPTRLDHATMTTEGNVVVVGEQAAVNSAGDGDIAVVMFRR